MPRLKTKRFLRVKLDMVNRCQLRCIMCHFAHPDFVESMDDMDRPLLEKIAADIFPIAHDVVLSSSSEPLMAPELPRALELCREYEVPFFHFSTNAMSLTRDMMRVIVQSRMPVMTISSDGATRETFEKIRKPAGWDKFLSKFELIEEVKRELDSDLPRISVTCVLMRDNIEEMPEFVRFYRKLGVTEMNFVHMGVLGGMGMDDQTLAHYPGLSNQMLAEAARVAEEVGVHLMAPLPFPETFEEDAKGEIASSDEGGGSAIVAPDTADGASSDASSIREFLDHKNREFNLAVSPRDEHHRMCYFPWYYIHVNPNGTVFPCGHWFEFSSFGDFKTQSFSEIWTGPEFREVRRQIRHLELRPVCANCTVSGMGRPDVLASFSARDKQKHQEP